MKRTALLLSLLVSFAAVSAQEVSREEVDAAVAAAQSARTEHEHHGVAIAVDCPATPITPPVTINGALTTASCRDFLNLREDVYSVTVSAGTTIDIDYSSTAYDTFLYMYLGNATSAPVTTVSYRSTSGVSRQRIHHTFATGGTYYIEAEALWSASSSQPNTGPYTLVVSFAGGCVPNATTACLLNSRFRATVRYRGAFDNAAADTSAQVKSVTGFANPSSETVFFYFNSPDNIEMMLKMLDQGNTNGAGQPTIAVLFGSATPLRVEVTITDTKNNAVKTYTSAFAEMKGGTDFTAFVK
ncbi:MAG TPA: PPC domain-containing protein [Thermoanaerobaculia bacterium]|nr:PPC domain-containing protein [Thermoanaerobaculia bacterium]